MKIVIIITPTITITPTTTTPTTRIQQRLDKLTRTPMSIIGIVVHIASDLMWKTFGQNCIYCPRCIYLIAQKTILQPQTFS